jgi:hypothetical protein
MLCIPFWTSLVHTPSRFPLLRSDPHVRMCSSNLALLYEYDSWHYKKATAYHIIKVVHYWRLCTVGLQYPWVINLYSTCPYDMQYNTELREHGMNGYSYYVRTVFLFIKESDRPDVGVGGRGSVGPSGVFSPPLPSLNSSNSKISNRWNRKKLSSLIILVFFSSGYWILNFKKIIWKILWLLSWDFT